MRYDRQKYRLRLGFFLFVIGVWGLGFYMAPLGPFLFDDGS